MNTASLAAERSTRRLLVGPHRWKSAPPIEGRRVVFSEEEPTDAAATDGSGGVVFSGLSVHSAPAEGDIRRTHRDRRGTHGMERPQADAKALAQDIRQWRKTLTHLAPSVPSALSERKQ